MAAAGVNVASQFSGDYSPYLDKKVLPLALKELSVYQFADKHNIPKGSGPSWTATRWQRVKLPYAPLAEAVSPTGQTMAIEQVTCVAQQWGDTITVSDIAQYTIMHDPFQQAIRLIALQEGETQERNTFNMLMGTAQVNYANQKGARASLAAGDVLNPGDVLRTVGALLTLGARRFSGPEGEDTEKSIGKGSGELADQSPQRAPHYAAVCHTLCVADWSQNSTVILSRSYSAVNRLYNYEVGEWGGCRFVYSNMVPTFTGYALVTGTPGTAGNLGTNTMYVLVTGSDTQNGYESYIAQVSGALSVSGTTGSISVTVPSTAGYTYSVYTGLSTSPTNLGKSVSGPTTGPLAGMATQLAPGTTAIITDIGTAQVPPAAPATGITVYPTFIFGVGAYAIVTLSNIEHFMLSNADKSDPLNQKSVVGWKGYWGGVIKNQQFLARLETTSAYSATFG
jgi:N4-gp56 family major capsid protein